MLMPAVAIRWLKFGSTVAAEISVSLPIRNVPSLPLITSV